MRNFGEKNIIEILKEYTEMKLIVYRNNKEEGKRQKIDA